MTNIIFATDKKDRPKLMKIIPVKMLIYVINALLLVLPLASFTNNSKHNNFRIRTIVIDAGHGGKATGAAGRISLEKEVTLQVAMRLGKAIESQMPDVKIVYTRTTDVHVRNIDRPDLANKLKADLFISIHCNSMPVSRVISGYRKDSKGRKVPIYESRQSTSTRGVETFVAGFGRLDEQDVAIRENADILLEKDYKDTYGGYDPKDPESMIMFSLMKNIYREQSIKLASLMQDEYVATGRINRGVKEQNILILQRAGMPSILTEIGFISNPQEEEYINSETGQNEIVNCLLKAIQNYKRQVELE